MTNTAMTSGMTDVVAEMKNSAVRRQLEDIGKNELQAMGTVVQASFTLSTVTFQAARQPASQIEALTSRMTKDNRHPDLLAGPAVGNEEW